jgi:fucose permease
MIQGVIAPYVILSAFLFIFGFLFYKSPIKDINPDTDNKSEVGTQDRKSVWAYPYLVLGVIALFCHLGSQQISIATIIEYAQSMGMSLDAAKVFPSYTLACILCGYLIGVVTIPKFISQQKALVICTVTGLILSALVLLLPVKASIWCVVLLGIPNSLIYAGIWPLAIRGLGKWTTLGSSLLVMALCGNAILSLLYGVMTDHMSLQASYWLLIPCFAFMIYYAVWGYKIEYWRK